MSEREALIGRLTALHIAASEGPWVYRPDKYDDWGWVRGVEKDSDIGRYRPIVAAGKDSDVTTEQMAEHRAAGTDPFEANAKLIVELRNALPTLLAALAMPDREAIARDAERRAVARCIEIVRQQREDFSSEDYAVGQPLSSFNERFACDQCAEEIGREFGMGSDEQRRLVGKPSHIEEYRASLALTVGGGLG